MNKAIPHRRIRRSGSRSLMSRCLTGSPVKNQACSFPSDAEDPIDDAELGAVKQIKKDVTKWAGKTSGLKADNAVLKA